jgi:hypothetical protein
MVKGVNRQIIEINDTGNRHFERVLLFVSAGSSELTDAELQNKAGEYLKKISPEFSKVPTLRERYRRKYSRKKTLLFSLGAVIVAISAILVFNIL